MTKTLLNQELDTDFASAIEAEAQGQAICMQPPRSAPPTGCLQIP